MEPETRYARSGDVSIAYQVTGEGPFDLVHVPPFTSHVELAWQVPDWAAFIHRLASFCAITEAVKDLGIEVRAGLHTGECELLDSKVGGIAVHIGARVAKEAAPAEVLASSEWRLFAVEGV